LTSEESPGGDSGHGPAGTARGETRAIELSRPEQLLGRRVAESRATIPDLTLQTSIDMEACAALRETADGDPTYLDIVVRACALALREQPRANSSYRDGRLLVHSRVNVAVTLAGLSPHGGALPTIFDADRKSLAEIAAETAVLAGEARAGPLAPAQLAGATFTVADLAPHRLDAITAAVNPLQAAILAIGSVVPRAVVYEGLPLARKTLIATLACDQRILDRGPAAGLLERIRELLEGAPAEL
jgi:pyruvate dehydrogenase E2 component (dihydrolipoamide acetyltransferase)